MEYSAPTAQLKEMIRLKEIEHAAEAKVLLLEFRKAGESLKPINILKHTLKDMTASPEMKSSLANAAIGLATGFVAKKLFVWTSKNPLTAIGGNIIESLVGNMAIKNADGIKSIGVMLFRKFFSKNQSNENNTIDS